MTAPTPEQQGLADQIGEAVIPCITQDPTEPAGQQYRDVCTGSADLMATSVYCEDGTGCGGHPICRPCYDLARAQGLVR